MKAAITVNHAQHQKTNGEAMLAGLKRHGIDAVFAAFNTPDESADFHVTWGVKQPKIWDWRKRTGRPVLIQERGHLQDRMVWTSCGWNGLGRRATYARARDDGERWRKHFAHLLRPWQPEGERVVVFGQVPGDAAVHGLDLKRWAIETCAAAALALALPVVFRPHPLCVRQGDAWAPPGVAVSTRPLAEDLDGAYAAVTYNSTAGVETVLGGVPTVTLDEGAMAWPVASHGYMSVPHRPDRSMWAHDLAWSNFTIEEIANGSMWDVVGRAEGVSV